MASRTSAPGLMTEPSSGAGQRSAHGPLLVTALTFLALAVHGYHPWAEDGGLYAAGIKHLLSPQLYPHATEFVTEHLRFSIFAPVVAALTRATHLPLDWMLLLLYCLGIWATLLAAWELASRCFLSTTARGGAVTLLACWLTLPLAGTSLMLMDPYLTARSFSTPLTLFALCWALDALHSTSLRPWLLCAATLILAAAFHPLMTGYGIASVLLLACLNSRFRVWGTFALTLAALLLAVVIQLHAPPESPDYLRVALTRYYWFPGQWEWYERIGLIAPLAILAGLSLRKNRTTAYSAILRMTLALALIALFLAAIFSRARLSTHAVARLQPLRTFQTVYIVMILFVGAALAEYLLKQRPWRWVALVLLACAPMVVAQRNIFPASLHLELPWRTPVNPWVQAFLWVRGHTPTNSFFALDPHYITTDGEDAQTFRAIAERSTLPDYSKDGGEASITPELTPAWIEAQRLQANLDHETDDQRRAALQPSGVDWLILRTSSPTALPCTYQNNTVKVCHMR